MEGCPTISLGNIIPEAIGSQHKFGIHAVKLSPFKVRWRDATINRAILQIPILPFAEAKLQNCRINYLCPTLKVIS
jgi:hypothetical protein